MTPYTQANERTKVQVQPKNASGRAVSGQTRSSSGRTLSGRPIGPPGQQHGHKVRKLFGLTLIALLYMCDIIARAAVLGMLPVDDGSSSHCSVPVTVLQCLACSAEHVGWPCLPSHCLASVCQGEAAASGGMVLPAAADVLLTACSVSQGNILLRPLPVVEN